jgi:hypothetical protein
MASASVTRNRSTAPTPVTPRSPRSRSPHQVPPHLTSSPSKGASGSANFNAATQGIGGPVGPSGIAAFSPGNVEELGVVNDARALMWEPSISPVAAPRIRYPYDSNHVRGLRWETWPTV